MGLRVTIPAIDELFCLRYRKAYVWACVGVSVCVPICVCAFICVFLRLCQDFFDVTI